MRVKKNLFWKEYFFSGYLFLFLPSHLDPGSAPPPYIYPIWFYSILSQTIVSKYFEDFLISYSFYNKEHRNTISSFLYYFRVYIQKNTLKLIENAFFSVRAREVFLFQKLLKSGERKNCCRFIILVKFHWEFNSFGKNV